MELELHDEERGPVELHTDVPASLRSQLLTQAQAFALDEPQFQALFQQLQGDATACRYGTRIARPVNAAWCSRPAAMSPCSNSVSRSTTPSAAPGTGLPNPNCRQYISVWALHALSRPARSFNRTRFTARWTFILNRRFSKHSAWTFLRSMSF